MGSEPKVGSLLEANPRPPQQIPPKGYWQMRPHTHPPTSCGLRTKDPIPQQITEAAVGVLDYL